MLVLAACAAQPATPASPATVSSPQVSTGTSTPVAAACRLPIASGDAPVDGVPTDGTAGHGGFVTYPGGAFSPDPASLGSYDARLSKWVPAFTAAVSPDGSHYASTPQTPAGGGPVAGSISITDVATGASRSVPVPGPSGVVAWTSSGIYVTHIVPNSDAPSSGLSLLDPATGAFHQITADGGWQVVGTAFAYSTSVNPADPSPPTQQGPGSPPGDQVVSLNLSTGVVSTVEYQPGKTMAILGLDAGGRPVTESWDASGLTIRVAGAAVYTGAPPSFSASGDPSPNGPLAHDSHGLWFGSGTGAIYLLAPGATSLVKIATVSVSAPGSSTTSSANIAGPCA